MTEERTDVIIVGGGAAGMFSAILCARCGKRVVLFEQKKQLGKKLLATGNGKCNYTNLYISEDCYGGEQDGFVEYGIHAFGPDKAVECLKKMGIYPKNKNGYIYPYSEQASAVLDIFEMEIHNAGIHVKFEKVLEIQKKKDFIVRTENGRYTGKQLVLATGGKASPKLGSDGSGFVLARKLGHRVVDPVPALIGLKCSEAYYKEISGVRVFAEISLYVDQEKVQEEKGELQLTSYGISGIPVFQLSRYAARALEDGKSVSACIDYMPEFTKEELELELTRRFRKSDKNASEALIGLLNQKLIQVFLPLSGISKTKKASSINAQQIKQLAVKLKKMNTKIVETNGFEQAQVTAGGVSTDEIDEKTMESKLIKDFYLVGEVMDVDGICGGYNLQWCWISAYLASCAICGMDCIEKIEE